MKIRVSFAWLIVAWTPPTQPQRNRRNDDNKHEYTFNEVRLAEKCETEFRIQ